MLKFKGAENIKMRKIIIIIIGVINNKQAFYMDRYLRLLKDDEVKKSRSFFFAQRDN